MPLVEQKPRIDSPTPAFALFSTEENALKQHPRMAKTQKPRALPCLDEVLRYSLLVDNDCEAVLAGKQGEILKKSLWVEQTGVEPLDISKIKW
ncbi:MAG: hypothetical protein ACPGYS_05765 [Flavobacteriales bacterium]